MGFVILIIGIILALLCVASDMEGVGIIIFIVALLLALTMIGCEQHVY